MFKIVPNPTFTCDVPLSVPGEEKPALLKFIFRHKTRTQLNEYQARSYDLALQAGQEGAAELYVDYLAEIIDGWAGLQDAKGAAMPYTRENLALLLDQYASAGPEIVRAYRRQLADARSGN